MVKGSAGRGNVVTRAKTALIREIYHLAISRSIALQYHVPICTGRRETAQAVVRLQVTQVTITRVFTFTLYKHLLACYFTLRCL